MVVGLTAPLTATATSVAPELERVMEEEISPAGADAATRANKVPPLEGKVAVGPKETPSLETWKPDGPVAVMLDVKFEPKTPILCEAEAVPANVVNGAKEPPGEIAAASDTLTEMLSSPMPEEVPDSVPRQIAQRICTTG